MGGEKKIILSHVTFGYNEQDILFDDISLTLSSHKENGHIISIMGGSGSGKSSFVKLILGLEAYEGTITTSPEKSSFMYLPQDLILFDHLSPLENAQYFRHTKYFGDKFDNIIFNDLVNELGMEKEIYQKKKISELSGGQKQRISLIRALSCKPDFLIIDEGTKGLDSLVKSSFLKILKSLVNKYRLFILYITHDKEDALQISDEILYIRQINESTTLRQLDYFRVDGILPNLN